MGSQSYYEDKMSKKHSKFIHEGDFAAEVPVVLHESENGWAPYITKDDALKLDKVRRLLIEGKLDEAKALAKVFALKPV